MASSPQPPLRLLISGDPLVVVSLPSQWVSRVRFCGLTFPNLLATIRFETNISILVRKKTVSLLSAGSKLCKCQLKHIQSASRIVLAGGYSPLFESRDQIPGGLKIPSWYLFMTTIIPWLIHDQPMIEPYIEPYQTHLNHGILMPLIFNHPSGPSSIAPPRALGAPFRGLAPGPGFKICPVFRTSAIPYKDRNSEIYYDFVGFDQLGYFWAKLFGGCYKCILLDKDGKVEISKPMARLRRLPSEQAWHGDTTNGPPPDL